MATKNTPTQPATDEKPIIAWEALEFTEYERNKGWYVLVAIAGVLLTIGALLLQQWLTAVVFVLGTYVVMRHANDKPRTFHYSIGRHGVQAADKYIPFNDLKSYWIVYNPPTRNLTLQRTGRFKPLIKIHLGEVDPDAVHTALKEHLPENA